MLIADTPHLLRDGHCFDRGFLGWEWLRGQEGDSAITSATLPKREDHCVCSSITDGNWTLHYRRSDWPAELYAMRTDPAQKRNCYERQNEAIGKHLHRAHLEVLRNAHTPEEKLRLRLKLLDF